MKKVTAALAVLLALTLTGCAEAGESASGERVAPAAAESSAPLAAEAPTDEPSVSEADAAFLQYVHDEIPPTTSIGDASDEQLITAGHEACEQAAAAVPWQDIRLVEGEEPTPTGDYLDSSAILNGALYHYCPELIPAVD